jgi:ElaB/YqjD/DUF883 family membrane-anchored ribosome-binding protein
MRRKFLNQQSKGLRRNNMDNVGTGSATEQFRTDWSTTPDNGGGTGEGTSDLAGLTSGLSDTAHEYIGKISDVAIQAKDYVTDKAGVAGEKIKEFATDDLGQLAGKAKDFARQNPGQAILISAAAGLVLGLLVRGRR